MAIDYSTNGTGAIVVPDTAELQNLNGFSISFWTKISSYGGFSRTIGKGGIHTGSQAGWNMYFIPDTMTLRYSRERVTSNSLIRTATAFPLDTLCHVVLTDAPTEGRFFIDGVEPTYGSQAPGSGDYVSDIGINLQFFSTPGIDRPLAGWMEDVRLYNRVLDDDEPRELYLQRGRDTLTDGLIGRWPMYEGAPGDAVPTTNGVVKDIVGGNHGTAQNTNGLWADSYAGERRFV